MGGMQMGVNPATSVVDGNGRMHQMDNVFWADGSVFATSGGSNPTNTIMAGCPAHRTRDHRQALPGGQRRRPRIATLNGLQRRAGRGRNDLSLGVGR
jgi:GMC oxidoreductase